MIVFYSISELRTFSYRTDFFFLNISFNLAGDLFDRRLDLLEDELLFSISLMIVRGSASISANDTPGKAAVLTNFSIDSAHNSLLR